jgi:hypothetical protein
VWGAPPAGVGCHQNHLAERNSYGVFNKCAHGHQTAGRNRTHRLTWSRVVSMRGRPRFGRWRRGRLTKTDPAQAPHPKPRAGALPKTPRSPLPIAGRSSRRAVEESTPLWSLFVQWPRSRYYQILDVSSTGVAA